MCKDIPYQICSKTVMDTSDSRITFNEDGVCDHATDFFENVLPKWDSLDNRKIELERIVQEIKTKGKGQEYDSILGLSGGLDSSYMLHVAVKELGLRPLVFHVDCGWNTDNAVHNIKVLIDSLGLDLYTDVVNWEQMKDFQLAFFKSGLPHIDIPQDQSFISALYKYANKFKIKSILNGGNISTEGVRNPLEYFYHGTDMIHLNHIIKKFAIGKLNKLNISSIYWNKIYLRYLKGVKVFKPLNYLNYLKKDATLLLTKEYNWKPHQQKHFESRFTRFHEGFWLRERFGFDTRRVQLSSLILSNQITRDEALSILNEPPLDKDTIRNEFEFIARKLDISIKELESFFNMPKKFYWDYPNQNQVFKLGGKFLKKFGSEFAIKR